MRMSGIQSGDLLIMSVMLFTDASPGHSMMTSSWTWPTILYLERFFIAKQSRSRDMAWTMFSTNLGPYDPI